MLCKVCLRVYVRGLSITEESCVKRSHMVSSQSLPSLMCWQHVTLNTTFPSFSRVTALYNCHFLLRGDEDRQKSKTEDASILGVFTTHTHTFFSDLFHMYTDVFWKYLHLHKTAKKKELKMLRPTDSMSYTVKSSASRMMLTAVHWVLEKAKCGKIPTWL